MAEESTNRPTPAGETILEQGRRLSDSVIWQLNREFYDQAGVRAWSYGIVPHTVTNTPLIARAACRVLLGFLRDLCRSHDGRQPGQPPALDPGQPVYVLELGAGAGRFGFLFLQALKEIAGADPLQRLKVCLVMADFTRSNVDYWASHPQLRPYVDDGWLDFAVLDAEADQEIRLERSGVCLKAGELGNPLVVVANYLFDTLTADAFQIREGRLYESLVTVLANRPDWKSGQPLENLSRLRVRYQHRAIDEDYYASPDWNRLLREYRQTLGDTGFSIPVGAFRCVDNLLKIAGGRLLLLASDKSWNRAEQHSFLEDPQLVVHGSFSLNVNFHALGRLFENRGGQVMHSGLRDTTLDHVALLEDPRLDNPREMGLAFRDHLSTVMPLDFHRLVTSLREAQATIPLQSALELIRFSGWDPDAFYSFSTQIAEEIAAASPNLQAEMVQAVERIWAACYHYGPEQDVAFDLARILHHLRQFQDALRFYQASLGLFGERKQTRHDMGMIYAELGHLEAALDCFHQALEQDPTFSDARTWLLRVQALKTSREELRKSLKGQMP